MTFSYAVLEQLDKLLEPNQSSISSSRISHFMTTVEGGHVLRWTIHVFYDLHLTVPTFQLFEQLGKFMVKQNMFLRFNFDLWWKKINEFRDNN